MNKKYPLVFFLSSTLFIGIGYSNIFKYTNNDAIISCILGTILGLLFIYIINKTNNNKLFKYLNFILDIIFIILGVMILETFISSFYLRNTPRLIIILPAIILFYYSSLKNNKVINYTLFILFVITLLFLSINEISLINYLSFSNITLFNTNISNIIKGSLNFALLSSIPNILLKNENILLNKHLKYYLITSLINTLICFIIIFTLKGNAYLYSFPEFMVLKKIKILKFIENVENISATYLYLIIYSYFTLTIKNINNIVNNKITTFLILLFTTLLTSLIIQNYIFALYIYNYLYLCFLIVIIILFINIKKEYF